MDQASQKLHGVVSEDHVKQLIGNFTIDGWYIEPETGHISRGKRFIRLEPKLMHVLVYLAQHAGQVASRTKLEAEVWKGSIVSYDAVTGSIQKLRKIFDDDARNPRIFETLSKRGYRLIAHVSSQDEQSDGLVHTLESIPTQNQWMSTRLLTLLSLLLLAVAVMWWLYPWQANDNTLLIESAPRSIAVLPFENLSNDPEQEYFTDGITEDIITDLSTLSNLIVVARNTAFSYKAGEAQAQSAADDLGVRYVLQGSVRKSGDRLRITTQLIDVQNGNHIWAERYDRKLVEIFALQDEVTQHIVSALAITLTAQEKEVLARPSTNNFEAYDLFLQGQQHLKQRTEEGNRLARVAYKHAIELDPAFARAYGALAVVLTVDFRQGWTESPVEAQERALVLARKAVALKRTSPQAYWALGYVYLYRKQFNEATDALEHAIE
ncbi:MAG: hypothetical protein HKP41_01345, partial [Desulfobacterales bacterium]|nr:hypothetical protein [Desulfobacterales bacterium]